MRFISLDTYLLRKEYLAKINNLPNPHGVGPPEARGPMQLHRLHRLKAGPDPNVSLAGSVLSRKHGLTTLVHERLE